MIKKKDLSLLREIWLRLKLLSQKVFRVRSMSLLSLRKSPHSLVASWTRVDNLTQFLWKRTYLIISELQRSLNLLKTLSRFLQAIRSLNSPLRIQTKRFIVGLVSKTKEFKNTTKRCSTICLGAVERLWVVAVSALKISKTLLKK